jgi:hypothetical protein
MSSNEKEISDGYRKRAPIEVEGFKSLENAIAQRLAVRCIAWLDLLVPMRIAKQLLLHLTKRSHGCQRVHIVPPLHDLSALDGNDRDEPVVV